MCITMTVNNRYDLNGHLKKMLNIAYRMKFMSVIFCCSHSKQTGTCRCKRQTGSNAFYRQDCLWFNVVFPPKCVQVKYGQFLYTVVHKMVTFTQPVHE